VLRGDDLAGDALGELVGGGADAGGGLDGHGVSLRVFGASTVPPVRKATVRAS